MPNKIKSLLFASAVYLFFPGCQESQKEWRFENEIKLDDIKPLSVVVVEDQMWLTDVDQNRLVKTDIHGKPITFYPGLMRPMHISYTDYKYYIPEFLRDTITILEDEHFATMPLDVELDAPAGIDVVGNIKAIVDFYNHRLIVINNGKSSIIGKKGHDDGEFNYPTDVALYDDKIFVADAYNNRVQVFDYEGKVLKVIGWNEDINVASGLAVGLDRVYVTDFHGDRVLIYDFNGVLLSILSSHFNKPTDVFINQDHMYVANYGGGSVAVFSLK